MTAPGQDAQACATCDADPSTAPGRYCASLACRCGHPACPAFASWQPLAPPADATPPKAKRNAWANRKESTWIDQL